VGIAEIWNLIAVQPLTNVLIVLSDYLFDNFGLAIIGLTIIVNILMYPLTRRQLRATKDMQALQPKLAEIKKKYAKDKEKLGREQMKLYKESGMSPAGCVVPMLVQMPIWIALFYSIRSLLPLAPEGLLSLSQKLYSWDIVYSMVPLSDKFLWLNLALPDKYLVLPILVGGTMWIQQKMSMISTADPKQQAQSRMMLWLMPLMFAFITLQFPSGLALYWVTSSVIRIGIQYLISGWGGLVSVTDKKRTTRDSRYRKRIAEVEETPLDDAEVMKEEESADDGKPGDKRQDRGGSYPTRSGAIGPRPRRGRGHRPKRR
jgi:YidC/Oxa1 family membrane protein insertase